MTSPPRRPMTSPPRRPAPPPRQASPQRPRRRVYRRYQPPPEADTILLPALSHGTHFPARPGEASRYEPPEPQRPRRRHGSRPPRARRQQAATVPAGRRRTWISRGVLAAILCVQAIISLRLSNTAFEDEALYLYAGHMEWGHLLNGTPLQGDYATYFSGAPVLYPLLGALADTAGGLAAARAVSLAAMLTTTALLYTLSRRLFNERVALCAALIFSVTESTLFLGHLATYDAPALCLLAAATWIVVRTAAMRWPVWLLAAPVAALAVADKYAALLFVPTIIALSGLASWPHRGAWALLRPVWLTAFITTLLLAALRVAGPSYLQGIEFTTLSRFQGSTPARTLLWDCLQWGGLPFALAVIGAAGYAWRPENEAGEEIAPAGSRWRRSLLGLVLTATALLAPIEQIRIHTETSLFKHIGFGLFFAAPLAGVGLARILGDHFRRAQAGIAIWGATLVLGMTQAAGLFHAWPSSQLFVQELSRYLRPGAHYLVEVDEVPIYYLRTYPDAQPGQFTSTYYIGYRNAQGQLLTGTAGYLAAIKAGYFRVIAYDGQVTPALDLTIARALRSDPHYRLAAAIPSSNGATYYVWVSR